MKRAKSNKRALIVDDEPEYLRWVVEFLESKKMDVTCVRTLPESFAILTDNKFDIVVIDMNIPSIGAITDRMIERCPLVQQYPGIAVAQYCRDHGYGAHAVIAYTVHDDDAADRELAKLHCRYVLKGRPFAFKSVINKSLGPSPE